MDLEAAKARIDELENENKSLTDDNASLKGKVASFEEQEVTAAKAARADRIESLVKAGNITPAEKPMMIGFCEMLATSDQTIEFGEGDDKQEFSGVDGFFKFLEGRKAVDFSEKSPADENEPKELSSEEIARQAKDFQEAERKNGNEVDVATAVNHVLTQQS